MTTGRLVLMTAAWVLAAGAVAVTVAVLITEILVLLGLIDRSGAGYGRSLAIVTAASFVFLASVPFLFRHRFADLRDPDRS